MNLKIEVAVLYDDRTWLTRKVEVPSFIVETESHDSFRSWLSSLSAIPLLAAGGIDLEQVLGLTVLSWDQVVEVEGEDDVPWGAVLMNNPAPLGWVEVQKDDELNIFAHDEDAARAVSSKAREFDDRWYVPADKSKR